MSGNERMDTEALLQRLRNYYTEDNERYCIGHPICDEAADEIERLLEKIETLKQASPPAVAP